jgi:hypothetical protein
VARKPNYQFDRMERERAKAAKAAAKKRDREAAAAAENPGAEPPKTED